MVEQQPRPQSEQKKELPVGFIFDELQARNRSDSHDGGRFGMIEGLQQESARLSYRRQRAAEDNFDQNHQRSIDQTMHQGPQEGR